VPLLALLACLGPGMLAAQTVVRPAPPLDSARAAVRDAVLVLRDSLLTIDAAAARLQRDYQAASSQWLLSRARSMYDACARSARTLPSTRLAVQRGQLNEPLKVKRRQELLGAMDHLKEALGTCESEFEAMSKPGQAERVRGYGNDRATRVQSALRRYEVTLRDFLGTMGIRVLPLGVGAAPST
jgi:hypothetical protein